MFISINGQKISMHFAGGIQSAQDLEGLLPQKYSHKQNFAEIEYITQMIPMDLKKFYSNSQRKWATEYVQSVAENARLICDWYRTPKRIKQLAIVTALFHDVLQVNSDSQAATQLVYDALTKDENVLALNQSEITDLRKAIHNCYNPPRISPKLPIGTNYKISELLHFIIYYAVELESSSITTLIRSIATPPPVNNKQEEGGTQEESNQPIPIQVLAHQFDTPLPGYPTRLQPLFAPLQEQTRNWLLAASVASGFDSQEEIASSVTKALPENGNRATEVQSKLPELGITKQNLNEVTDNEIKSWTEIERMFKSKYYRTPSLESIMLQWEPLSKLSQRFKKQLKDYLSGKWHQRMRENKIWLD